MNIFTEPGLCVMDYASSIKEIIDWIDGVGALTRFPTILAPFALTPCT